MEGHSTMGWKGLKWLAKEDPGEPASQWNPNAGEGGQVTSINQV